MLITYPEVLMACDTFGGISFCYKDVSEQKHVNIRDQMKSMKYA